MSSYASIGVFFHISDVCISHPCCLFMLIFLFVVRGIFLGSSSHIAGIGNTAESTQGMVAVASRMTTSSHSHIAQPRHSAVVQIFIRSIFFCI